MSAFLFMVAQVMPLAVRARVMIVWVCTCPGV